MKMIMTTGIFPTGKLFYIY